MEVGHRNVDIYEKKKDPLYCVEGEETSGSHAIILDLSSSSPLFLGIRVGGFRHGGC